ncbi:MAG: biotin--[acetyl-CoA-carboxylase] ligase [Muribaculaceae bacterium]|nr:biotin--[acetyl-CoA-carboxylase] ligase [Muribaculaceae bacterium]
MAVMRIDSLESTNTYMRGHTAEFSHGDVLVVREQTAGRGQRGNSWEAEPGRNLTFSMMLHPAAIRPADAFLLSMLTAMSIADTLGELLDAEVCVKWPNDIYVGDRKMAGILIENSFSGSTYDHAVLGVGLNVNQTRFISDAPNPVSMAQIAGREFDLDEVLLRVTGDVIRAVESFDPENDVAETVSRYNARLWRGSGEHSWHDNITGEDIVAAIARVEPSGHIVLACDPPRRYAFKEVAAIILR